MLSTAYFTMPGLVKTTSNAEDSAKAFHNMSTRSAVWLNRIAFPATIAYSYAAYYAPSHPEDFINAKSLLTTAAITVGLVIPYSYFKMSGPAKRLQAAGKAAEINEEKNMGLAVVDDEMVRNDLNAWTSGDQVRGWLVLTGFLIGTYVEVFYLK